MCKYLIKHRRGNAKRWEEKSNLIPEEGEMAIEMDEGEANYHKFKLGDGKHKYGELPYFKSSNEILEEVKNLTPPELENVALGLNEPAPEETVSSICDFIFTPTTMEAAYGLYYTPFMPNNVFFGKEVPTLTTKGTLSVKDIDGNVKYSKYIEPMFNARGVADTLTHKGLEKKWSKKFYLNKKPISVTHIPPRQTWHLDNYVFVWEFDESEFINSGIPAKVHDIPMASACFINNDKSEDKVNDAVIYGGTPYPAFFSYNEETGKYTLTARGLGGGVIDAQLTGYSKVYFYYQLDTSYSLPFNFAMSVEAGDQITFDEDLEDAQPYIDHGKIYATLDNGFISEFNTRPEFTVSVPRNVKDAIGGMSKVARILNTDETDDSDSTVQGYSWIGEGDGVTDYTTQIQSKINELHFKSNCGTVYLGPGTYCVSESLIVYSNIQIIGCGKHTTIRQTNDNTHVIIVNGSNVVLEDFSIHLGGACSELTACVYVNSNNPNGDDGYPPNTYATNLIMNNILMSGGYRFESEDGKPILGDVYHNYKGVGIMNLKLYFNYARIEKVYGRYLMATMYGGGGGNYLNITAEFCKYGVYTIWGGNNQYFVNGHSYYSGNKTDGFVSMSDYFVYDDGGTNNMYFLSPYDGQHFKSVIYFTGCSQSNTYSLNLNYAVTGASPNIAENVMGQLKSYVTDLGRGNVYLNAYQNKPWVIGNKTVQLGGLPSLAISDPAIRNALSGAGVWGNISSNVDFDEHGISLSEICRYPSERAGNSSGLYLPHIVSSVAASEDNPIEVIIDIRDRPIFTHLGYFIQFDHRYIATDFTVSYDIRNNGEFDESIVVTNNTEVTPYDLLHQRQPHTIYRIKFTFTKPLQIENYIYAASDYKRYEIDYNPDGLIGICNIGMTVNDYAGRSFLGECGGSLYGNVDMHENTLKNLAEPKEEGDAVNKAYLDSKLKEIMALLNKE